MKIILPALILTLSIQVLKAQDNTLTGSVQDVSGKPLRYAFVEDSKYETAVLSDSLGNFSIPVHPDSKLAISSNGHRDTSLVAAKAGANLQIVLKPTTDAPAVTVPVETTLAMHRAVVNDNGQLIPAARKPNLQGNPYLLATFGHGFFTDMNGKDIYSPAYLMDYDKVSGFLLVTIDKLDVLQVKKNQIKSFVIYNNADQRFEFKIVPAIDKEHYVQVLASGPKYSIYKLIKTTFTPSNYTNTAAGQQGNDYDEYDDDADYYIADASNQPKSLKLKKKSIKAAFATNEAKAEKFMADNDGDIDDAYLVKLGAYMNQ